MKILGGFALVLATVTLAACGGSSNDSNSNSSSAGGTTDQATKPAASSGGSAEGKTVFTANCASCHTLAAAGASGTVGPDLDTLKPSEAVVKKQVENGGATMPAFSGTLSGTEISSVSAYVADNAGK